MTSDSVPGRPRRRGSSGRRRRPEIGSPGKEIPGVDHAIEVAVGPQIGRRAEGVPPDGVVGRVDVAVVVVVTRQRSGTVHQPQVVEEHGGGASFPNFR